MEQKTKLGDNLLVMCYFSEIGRGSHQDILRFVFDVEKQTNEMGTSIQWLSIFRGCISNPEHGIRSETVDDELNYWYCNNFIQDCKKCKKADICFEVKDNKFGKEYKAENMPHWLRQTTDGITDSDINIFMISLSKTLEKYKGNNICYQIN